MVLGSSLSAAIVSKCLVSHFEALIGTLLQPSQASCGYIKYE